MIGEKNKESGTMEEGGDGPGKNEGGCIDTNQADDHHDGGDSQLIVCQGERDENICNAGWESEENEIEPENDAEKGDLFFEGAEKLLEVWFTTKSKSGPECDLRNIPRFDQISYY